MKTVTTSVGFQDALGNLILGGNLVLTLSQAAEVTSGGGLIAPKVVVLPLNATTAKIASTQIWFNDELTPTGTTYHSELLDSGGNIIADFGQWSITGASADLSTMVPTSIGGPSAAGVVLTAPAATQTIVQPSGTNLNVNRFENIRYADQFPGADWGAKVAAAITDIGSSGGVVDCRALTGAQSMSASLTIGVPVTLLLGPMTLSMGSNQIIISTAVNYVGIIGSAPWGAASGSGSRLSYTGADYAIKIGASSATTLKTLIQDVRIDLGATPIGGVLANRTQFLHLNRVTISGASTNSFAFKSDGTGGFSAFTLIEFPDFEGCHIGAQFTGPASGNNANQIVGGTIQASGKADTGSIALDIETGDSNQVFGTDIENADIGLQIASSQNLIPAIRFEGSLENTHIKFTAASSKNTVNTINQAGLVITDLGTNNSVNQTGMFLQQSNGQAYWFVTPTDNSQTISMQAGSAADQGIALVRRDRTGTIQWNLSFPSSLAFNWLNQAGLAVLGLTQAGNTTINASNGAGNSVNFNASTNSGTGGIKIASGGASPAFVAQIDGTGAFASYRSVATAGNGAASIHGATSQKAESAADTSVLSFTPPAAAGQYRINFVLSLSAANAATIGWTATWTDSNAAAQAPTNLALFQSGVAAPALTFTTSAAGNYYGSAIVDVNNGAVPIVVKLTFTGTSFAGKASATIERLI